MTPLLNRDREGATTTYLITWVCYGAWLPGQSGAITRAQNRFGMRLPEPDAGKEQKSRNRMIEEPYLLDLARRRVVLKTLPEVCLHRGWSLLAAHVRTNHVHVVVTASCKPKNILIAMKAYSSRGLNDCQLDRADRRRWARHASTLYLWNGDAIRAAIRYVVDEQGEPMGVFEAPDPRLRSGF
jgi:REP element-mobilizing transposase RayT